MHFIDSWLWHCRVIIFPDKQSRSKKQRKVVQITFCFQLNDISLHLETASKLHSTNVNPTLAVQTSKPLQLLWIIHLSYQTDFELKLILNFNCLCLSHDWSIMIARRSCGRQDQKLKLVLSGLIGRNLLKGGQVESVVESFTSADHSKKWVTLQLWQYICLQSIKSPPPPSPQPWHFDLWFRLTEHASW
jgi:hypothetical protein